MPLFYSESQKAISVTSPDSQIDMMWFSRRLWQLNPHFVPFRHCGAQNSHICLPDHFPKLQLKHTNCGILCKQSNFIRRQKCGWYSRCGNLAVTCLRDRCLTSYQVPRSINKFPLGACQFIVANLRGETFAVFVFCSRLHNEQLC